MNIKRIFGALICLLVVTATFAQQPFGGCWHPDYIKDWTPEKDPDAKFNRSTVKLQPRFEDNIKANQYQFPTAKIGACLTMNPMCSMTPSQGANNFIGYNPTYWQYMDMIVWWGGSAGEGIIIPPSAPVTDICHMNGVKVLGNVFFPPTTFSGNPEWVRQMLTKEGDTYPYAEKMYEIAKYYGFDGWFLNEETKASTQEEWAEWIKYFFKCAEEDGNNDMYIQWYDAGQYVEYCPQIMKAHDNVSYMSDYGLADYIINDNKSDLVSWGYGDLFFDKFYGGINASLAGLTGGGTYFPRCFGDTEHFCSAQLFNPEEKIWKSEVEELLKSGENCGEKAYAAMKTFFNNDGSYWTNSQHNPADVSGRGSGGKVWPGLANAIQERSTIQSKPFVSSFSAGLGKHRFVNGEKRGTQDWYHRGMQSILPTWRWWVETSSSDKLNFEYNWDDAYNVGTSVVVSGSMTANADHLTRLFKTNIAIESGDKFQLVYKTANKGTIEAKLADKTNPASFTTFKLNEVETVNGWTVAEADLSSFNGKTLAVIALNFKTTSAVSDYKVTLGQIGILPASYSVSEKVSNLQSQNQLQEEISDIRVVWDAPESEDVDHYDVYLTRNGKRALVGQTRNEGFYISKFNREAGEQSVEVGIVAVTKDMKEGEEVKMTLDYPEMTAPDVQITASPTLVKVGEQVTLTAIANKNPESYEWELPQGTEVVSKSGNTAVVKFNAEGSYSITVKVTNEVGETTETVNGLVEVNNTKKIENVALGKDIYGVSGEVAGEEADNILDGIVSTGNVHEKWCVGGSKEHWVIIDLKQSYQLYKFYIVDAKVNEGDADNLNSYKILLSNDLENWSEVVNTTGRKNENYHTDWIKPTVARYIKFVPYDNDAPITIRIWEFEAHGAEGSASLSTIPSQRVGLESQLEVKAGYTLGGAAKEDNFEIKFAVKDENIVTVSDLEVTDEENYKFILNGGKEVGNTEVTVTMINGDYQQNVSFTVSSFDASMVNLISKMIPTAEEGTIKPANNEKGELANITDGKRETTYFPDYFVENGKSVRFVFNLNGVKSINRFQAYFVDDPNNNEAALPTEVKFEISENGTDFEEVSTEKGGTDVSFNLAEARDAKAVAFTIGLGWYLTVQIAELEVYGKDSESAINSVSTDNFCVSPNPVSRGENLSVVAEGADVVEVYTLQGVMVKNVRVSDSVASVTTDGLSAGTYLVVVKGNDFSRTVKVVVK